MDRDWGFCWLDGFFHRENETPFDARLFSTGILVREEVRTKGTRMAFFLEHYESLRSRLSLLHISLQEILSPEEMQRQAVNLINKNRYFGGNNLRITIIHEPGQDLGMNHCLMECIALEHPGYVLNRKGYVLGLYDDVNIPLDRLTGKFARPPLPDLFARRYMRSRKLDDCILFNQKGHITSSINSTVFFRIKDEIHTPPLKDGSPLSVMRDQVIRLLSAAGDPVDDETSLRALDIEKAEEIFLSNTLDGIRWVVAVNRFRYYNHTGVMLTSQLNEQAFGSA